MFGVMERVKNEFIEVLLRENGKIGKFEIDFLNRYTQFVAIKLEEANGTKAQRDYC